MKFIITLALNIFAFSCAEEPKSKTNDDNKKVRRSMDEESAENAPVKLKHYEACESAQIDFDQSGCGENQSILDVATQRCDQDNKVLAGFEFKTENPNTGECALYYSCCEHQS